MHHRQNTQGLLPLQALLTSTDGGIIGNGNGQRPTACCQCRPFSQALTGAALKKTLGRTAACCNTDISPGASRINAICHISPGANRIYAMSDDLSANEPEQKWLRELKACERSGGKTQGGSETRGNLGNTTEPLRPPTSFAIKLQPARKQRTTQLEEFQPGSRLYRTADYEHE